MDKKMDKSSNINVKPVPMKLFAAWEVDRTPSNCIPRLCSLKITRLSLLTTLPPDLTSLSLAVKMQSSKRTLRSHEIPVPLGVSMNVNNTSINSGGQIIGSAAQQFNSSISCYETDLDLHFSLQYPHFIKRDGNRLLILLQRRKKYKTRTILGYKTLAEGVIRMDAVLQKSMDMTVDLNATSKGSGRPGMTIATLRATQVSSIPVDQDNKNNNSVLMTDRVNEYSDDDEEFSSGEENDEGLGGYAAKRNYAKSNYRKMTRPNDNDGDLDDSNLVNNPVDSDSEFENLNKEKGGSRAKMSRQRNFKQKIVSLLKRFKVPEELEGVPRGQGALRGERDLDALFQELDSLTCGEGEDSGQDMDSLSIGSTPKPSLRPFFTNSKGMLNENLSGIKEKVHLEKRDSTSESNKKIIVTTNPDRGILDWKNDSSGNEGGTAGTDPEAPNSDPQNAGSPPKEKERTDRENTSRNKLFRTTSGTAAMSSGKKKQSLNLTADPPKSLLDACLSPTNVEPRKTLLDQLSRTFATDEAVLPEVVTMIGPAESFNTTFTARLIAILSSAARPTFLPHNTAEVKAVLQALMVKIQKYCNSNAKPPSTIKILLMGGDWLEGAVLRHYVELLGIRPPDWVNHLRFYIVPLGQCAISRYLGQLDVGYAMLFANDHWVHLCERVASNILENTQTKSELNDLTSRIHKYLQSGGPCTQIPIAEAMVNYKDEDSCQVFVPFISDVRICLEGAQLSMDMEDAQSQPHSQFLIGVSSALSSSPPQSGRCSPPSSTTTTPASATSLPSPALFQESLELQVDYWTMPQYRPAGDVKDSKDKKDKAQDQGKNSVKSFFRHLQVLRQPSIGDLSNGLTLFYTTREKKQKMMRLGKKKEKDKDLDKDSSVDGIARLICSTKQANQPLRVYIDGTEWTGVKFFQLSSQWQTHIKNFPIGLIGAPLASTEIP